MKQRPHAATIIEWANGAQIQSRKPGTTEWKDCDDPAFIRDWDYRVKPAEPERVYPETTMTNTELQHAYDPSAWIAFESMVKCKKMANAALRHAIDHGQVVTREEFDRAVGDRKARDKAVAKHVRHKCYITPGSKICDLDLDVLVAEVKS